MSEEGYIKYRCDWIRTEPELFPGFTELNETRNRLRKFGLIGVYRNSVGYGNISLRVGASLEFHISGAATGHLRTLDCAGYAKVERYDFAANWVQCRGPIRASSESMTHAAIYEADPSAGAVIHAHHAALWKALLEKVPTTSASVAYGTPEMAGEIGRLFRETNLRETRLLAMAGHEDGIVAFSPGLGEALSVLLDHLSHTNLLKGTGSSAFTVQTVVNFEGCTPFEVLPVLRLKDFDSVIRCLEFIRANVSSIFPEAECFDIRVIPLCHHYPNNCYPAFGIFGPVQPADYSTVENLAATINQWVEARGLEWLIEQSKDISAPSWAQMNEEP